MIKSSSVLFRIMDISDKICREIQNAHFKFKNFFPKIVLFMI